MRFTQQRLFGLANFLRQLNDVKSGDLMLPDSIGLFDEDGELIAIAILNEDSKYDLEVLEDSDKKEIAQQVESLGNIKTEEPDRDIKE